MNVFVSPFNNPFLNLALEDYFLRGGADLPVAFFYINRPSVVLGRFQNPWLECNLPYLIENDIWMVRRQSGGGCVFHDEGNLNYCFIYPEGMINRRRGVELIQAAFQKVEMVLDISPRHDLWMEGKKISGSAFKQTKNASFHHGTFLISSDLDKLEKSLKHTIIPKESKSIASVRSQVIKLQDKYAEVTIEDVIDLVAHQLDSTPQILDSSLLSMPEVQKIFKEFTSWGWLWGETPLFHVDELKIHKGLVKEPFETRFTLEGMQGHLSPEKLKQLFPDFSAQEISRQVIF